MEANFEDTYLIDSENLLSDIYGSSSGDDCETSTHGSFTQTESCSSTSSSFLTVDTAYLSFDDAHDESTRLMAQLTSPPDDFCTSTGSVMSPLTPLGSQMSNQWYPISQWNGDLPQDSWPQFRTDPENPWLSSEEYAVENCTLDEVSYIHPPLLIPAGFVPSIGEFNEASNMALARAIFSSPSPVKAAEKEGENTIAWPGLGTISNQATIEPSRTLQAVLPSSPCTSLEPVTPLRYQSGGSVLCSSSPLSMACSSVLASQWETDESKYFSPSTSRRYKHDLDDHDYVDKTPTKRVKFSNGSSPYRRESGIDTTVIPSNTHPCPWPGCVRKGTNKPTMFKRQEHMKRHVRTVHEKEEIYPCWVPQCDKAFTRRDNLKSHLLKTHGRKTAGQRNTYVATLDGSSKFFDKEWQGRLNADGLPVGHPEHPEIR